VLPPKTASRIAGHAQSSLDKRSGRTNQTPKEATVERYHYDSHNQLREHLAALLAAYSLPNC
jgi:hypothetical protein